MEAEERTRFFQEPCQSLEMPLFAAEQGIEEVPFRHFDVLSEVMIDDELPPPELKGRCESNCACT